LEGVSRPNPGRLQLAEKQWFAEMAHQRMFRYVFASRPFGLVLNPFGFW
jgi:hypothetical protein